jgi:Zn-dependent metalloprotease
MACFYRGQEDGGGVHYNAGIPAKAFYLIALKLGSPETARLWIAALTRLASKRDHNFKTLAAQTLAAAAELKLDLAVVVDAWEEVGIHLSVATKKSK